MKAWFLLFRPWSYVATLVPFLVGAAIVQTESGLHWTRWALGILAGLFFQATVNLLNTWGDERSGVDDVPGAIRTTPQVHDGDVSLGALLAAALVCAAAAGALGTALCWYRDAGAWRFDRTLLALGFVGFLGATNYSTGIRFKYRGLGVPFVSVLMGPLEIAVACALLAPGSLGAFAARAWATLPIALLVGVILHGNDMRDIPTDRAAGIRTFATVLGPRRSLVYYWICHAGAYAPSVVLAARALVAGRWSGLWHLLPLAALPLTVATLRAATRVYRAAPANPPWRGFERGSGKIHLVFGLLYAAALHLAGWT